MKLNTIKNSTLISKMYPFFLSNTHLGDAFYMYQLISPGLSEEYVPYLSLTKIGEKTKTDPEGKDIDLLSVCSGIKGITAEQATEYLQNMMARDNAIVVGDGNNFPSVVMQDGSSLQKALIINLRDTIRWKMYRFFPGRYVDLLYTANKMLILQVMANKDTDQTWLEPQGLYYTDDIMLKNPIKVDLSTLEYPKDKFSGKSKASDINRQLKRAEWLAFGRKDRF